MPEEIVHLKVPRDFYDKIKRKVDLSNGQFKSVEDYINFVLQKILEETENVFTREEEEEVIERLRALGYL